MEETESGGDVFQSSKKNEDEKSNPQIPEEKAVLGQLNESSKYLHDLVKEMCGINDIRDGVPDHFHNAYNLLINEINRVWQHIYSHTNCNKPQITCTEDTEKEYEEPCITIHEKVTIPNRPECKYIGRILGPRGITVKQLEARTECRILIRGKGSIKNPQREALLRSRLGWEHLHEPLHVLISATDTSQERCLHKLENGVKSIQALLGDTNDEHKRCQLIQLAIINGTYRPTHYFLKKKS